MCDEMKHVSGRFYLLNPREYIRLQLENIVLRAYFDLKNVTRRRVFSDCA